MGLAITGTLGIIAQAKIQKHITEAVPIIRKMLQTDFRLDRALIENTLRQLNEEL